MILPPFQSRRHDATLTEIMRQSADSEIIQVLDMIRNKDPNWCRHPWSKDVLIIPRLVPDRVFIDSDIVIAHRNVTVNLFNQHIRHLKGLALASDPLMPVRGDTLLALQTYKQHHLTKGTAYSVNFARPCNGGYTVMFNEPADNGNMLLLPVSQAHLENPQTKESGGDCTQFAYGHCQTAHKAQGSEFDSVTVFANDYAFPQKPEFWNWLYTSCSRAKSSLIIVR